MSYEHLALQVEGPCCVIVLRRPDRLNAINSALLRELHAAIAAAASDSTIRGVVLTGSDKAFSTGADLTEAVEVVTPEQYTRFNQLWRTVTYAVEHLHKPVVAAIDGYCLTGGLELTLACDIRFASPRAQFAITSSKIGSVAGAGATQRLPRIVGRARALDLLFTGRTVDAEEALAIGLVEYVEDDPLAAATAFVKVVADRGPLSIALTKSAVFTGLNTDLESGLDIEASASALAFASQDKKEGMTAFLEKRPAVFRGE